MMRQWLYLAIATILIFCPAIGVASESILGEWLAVERTPEGLGIAKTYAKGGSVQITYGSLIDYRYNLTGNKLVLSAPPQEASVLYVEIKGSKLVLADISGNEQKLTRLSGDVKSGIIGKWSGDHHTGRKQIMHFTDSKNCYISVPILTEKETYSIKADNLTETRKGKKAEKLHWLIDNDILTITNKTTEKTERYRKKE